MSTDKWRNENTTRYYLRVANSTGIPDALKKMSVKTGITELKYIREVVTESLIRDGYLEVKKK
jgi:hypothetical protein